MGFTRWIEKGPSEPYCTGPSYLPKWLTEIWSMSSPGLLLHPPSPNTPHIHLHNKPKAHTSDQVTHCRRLTLWNLAGKRIAFLYPPQTVNDPLPPYPVPFLIPCWKWNLRNVVLMCWAVMMVGDMRPSVSMVFTRAPPQKNPPLWKMCWLSPGCLVACLCPFCPCSVVGWNHVCGFRRGGGHHHSTSVFPLCVMFSRSYFLFICIFVLWILFLFFRDLHNKMLFCDLYGNLWPHILPYTS